MRNDTLPLPFQAPGEDMLKVELPQYYREGFFSGDTLLHPELTGGESGVAGDPLPYTVAVDDFITGILLLSFMVAVVSFSNAKHFVTIQIRRFFYPPESGTTEMNETANELRFQLFLSTLTALFIAILFYFYTMNNISQTFILHSQYWLIFIFQAIALAYLLGKALLYTIVNSVFFDSKKNGQWTKSMLLITSIEGALLFPAVAVQTYRGLSPENVAIYFTVVLIIVKFLTVYKCYVIFFRRNDAVLQIFLYLCALEIVPMLFLWSTLVFTANSLKINF